MYSQSILSNKKFLKINRSPYESLIKNKRMDSKVQNNKEKNQKQRQEAKKAIEKYFHQLTVGCGNIECKNQHCLSSGQVDRSLTPNQAAVKAIQLYVEDAKLCHNLTNDNKQDIIIPSCSSKNVNEEDVDMKDAPNER